MDTISVKSILLAVSVILVSMIVSLSLWTTSIGMSIESSMQEEILKDYSSAGLSILVELSKNDEVDSILLYRLLIINKSSVKSYSVTKLDGSIVTDLTILLNKPLDRYKIVITGDVSTGFKVVCNQVSDGKGGFN